MNAQHQSVYIPNYLQAFDYPNADETPSPFQQHDPFDDRYNEDFDPFQVDFLQTTSTQSIQFLLETSTSQIDVDNGIALINSTTTMTSMHTETTLMTESASTTFNSTLPTTESITTTQNSTQSSTFFFDLTTESNERSSSFKETTASTTVNHTSPSPSTDSIEHSESLALFEHLNHTSETVISRNMTLGSFLRNNTDLIIRLLNRTDFLRRNLMNNNQTNTFNVTPEETARHLADRKTMRSLIHLIPPNILSQLQKNYSTITFNQSQYQQPAFPDPAILAEAAAQAGLISPGLYPAPNHLWHHNPNYYRQPVQIFNNYPFTKPTPTRKLIILESQKACFVYFCLVFSSNNTTTSTTSIKCIFQVTKYTSTLSD